MLINNYFAYQKRRLSAYELLKQQIHNEAELDRLLDKVRSKGLESLSKRERNKLDALSKNI